MAVEHVAVLTTVRGGVVVYVAWANRPRHEIQRRGWTMDRLLMMLRKDYRQADSVTVHFGPRGVPRTIVVDFVRRAIDDEVGYRVSLVRR